MFRTRTPLATDGESAHQQAVAGLASGRARYRITTALHGTRRRSSQQVRLAFRDRCSHAEVLDDDPLTVDPLTRIGKKASARDVPRIEGNGKNTRMIAFAQRFLCGLHRMVRELVIDPDVLGQIELNTRRARHEHCARIETDRAEEAAKLGDHRAQRRSPGIRYLVRPQQIGQLVARDGSRPRADEIREHQPALPARHDVRRQIDAARFDLEVAAQPQPHRHHLARHRS